MPPVEGEISQSFERTAQSAIAKSLDAVGDAAEGIDVERSIVQGAAAHVLIQAAENAELLVVGSRGRGGFAALLLGSVSEQCAGHAACPVVIVRHKDSQTDPQRTACPHESHRKAGHLLRPNSCAGPRISSTSS